MKSCRLLPDNTSISRMARPLVPRRHIAFKWPLDLHARIRDEISERGVSFAAFVYRACELYLEKLKSERHAATNGSAPIGASSLGLPRRAAPTVTIVRTTSPTNDAPSAVFDRYAVRPR